MGWNSLNVLWTIYDGTCISRGTRWDLGEALAKAWIVVSEDSTLDTLAAGLPSGFTVHALRVGEASLTVGLRALPFLAEPLRGSPASNARYYLEHRVAPYQLLLLQALPPDGKTSIHWHAIETEQFYPLWGECTISCGWPARQNTGLAELTQSSDLYAPRRDAPSKRSVPPGIVHQLVAGPRGALNAILVCDTLARTLGELEHQYVRWTERRRQTPAW